MSFIGESGLSFSQNDVVEVPQPGNPVSTRTKGELAQIAKNIGTELKTAEEGKAYILTASSRYYFDTQGRVAQIDVVKRIPVNLRGHAGKEHDWGVKRKEFVYDNLGRLSGLKTSRSTNGSLWRIMEQTQFIYEDGTFRIVQPIIDGFMAFVHP